MILREIAELYGLRTHQYLSLYNSSHNCCICRLIAPTQLIPNCSSSSGAGVCCLPGGSHPIPRGDQDTGDGDGNQPEHTV